MYVTGPIREGSKLRRADLTTGTIHVRQRLVPPFQLHMRYALLFSATSSRTLHLK